MGSNQQLLLRSGVVVPTDPSFSSVVLLAHFDGTNGSTTLTNSCPRGTTMVAHGATALTTTAPVFGTASLNSAGTTADYVTSGTSADYTFGTGDVTIEFAMNGTSNQGCMVTTDGAVHLIRVQKQFATVQFVIEPSFNISTGSVMTNGTWYRIAAVVSGGNGYLFLDGTLAAGPTTTGGVSVDGSTVFIGLRDTSILPYTGKIDELRITKGVARYTSNYTVAAAAFPDS